MLFIFVAVFDTMTLNEYHDRLKVALSKFQTDRRKACTIIALDGLAMLKARVQDDGEKADGSSFKEYSTNDLPAWYYLGKSRGEQLAGGSKTYTRSGYSPPFKKMVARQAKAGKGFAHQGWSYKEWREANNLQTDHKDFSFTGKMWKNIKIKLVRSRTGELQYYIGPNAPDEKQKLEWNEAQQGEILALSTSEQNKLASRYEDFVHDYFNKHI